MGPFASSINHWGSLFVGRVVLVLVVAGPITLGRGGRSYGSKMSVIEGIAMYRNPDYSILFIH